MMPRTSHKSVGLQMQVQEGKGFPNILFGSNLEKDKKSINLQPGYEYVIELDPYGQLTTTDFKTMSLDNRKCRLDHETFDNSTHPIYTEANCIYDCKVNLAFTTCKCIPWDFVNYIQGTEECDIFGRTCFYNMIETLAHGFDQNCSHCIKECDRVKYRRTLLEKTKLDLLKKDGYSGHCNQYICIKPESASSSAFSCSGSETLCEYIKDLNNTLSPRFLKQVLWPADYSSGRRINSTFFKMAQTFFSNTIIVRLRYKSSEIEFTKLDVRTTMTDKIANFGGTFGIWAELTGASLLGMINLLIISFKLLFRPRN